jgi:multidrug resistance efflux pump
VVFSQAIEPILLTEKMNKPFLRKPRQIMSSRIKYRNGAAGPLILAAIAISVLVLGGVFAVKYLNNGDSQEIFDPILATVERGDFVSQVLDQGEIQSSENVEIRCEVRARNGSTSVLSVVPEASRVEPGDFLVQLDSTSFEKELEQQRIAMANAETSVIQAESNLASAKATLREYIEGTYEEEKLTIENQIQTAKGSIETAKQRLQQTQETFDFNRKLQAKGFVTPQDLQASEFDNEKAKIELTQAQNDLKLAEKRMFVLENITRDKNSIQLEADIKAATVKLNSEMKARVVEKEKLAEIEELVSKCRIIVPDGVSGQVVYARESSRGGNDWELEEGATVRQNQVLIRLPNLDKMEVKTLINEQSITQITLGMPCEVKVDALNDQTLTGVVTRVNQYVESSRWMSSSVRKYAVFVKIFDPPQSLKPGMNAAVTVQVREESDVLMAPIQTVYAVQDKKFCLVKVGDDWETREIQIDGDNSAQVLIKSGLEEDDVLVMNPGAYKDKMNLPELVRDSKIELPEEAVKEAEKAKAKADKAPKKSSGPQAGAGGSGNFNMPASGAALIAEKDSDGDGKLTKDEAGPPYSYFFDRVDTDSDGFLSAAEADKSIKSMKKRMQSGGGGGPGGGRPGGGRGNGSQQK